MVVRKTCMAKNDVKKIDEYNDNGMANDRLYCI